LEDINRETQNKLVRSERIAAVGHLAAGVAHEINNPIGFISSNLNSLKGYAQDAKAMLSSYRELAQALERSIGNNKMDAGLPHLLNEAIELEDKFDINFLIEDMGELVEDCAGGAKRIKDIVFEMRYFAYPETQQYSSCSLNDLLTRLVTQFEVQLPAEATIENRCPPLPEIQCNIPHIGKVFENIIQNSIDYIESNGLISIDGTYDECAVMVGVSDNGHGIDTENLSNVFNPFFTTKEPGAGIGLGLTTSLNIIRMHNGDIDVTSEPHKRTTFTVRLPIQGV
jgi:signal transduction histidine kinase